MASRPGIIQPLLDLLPAPERWRLGGVFVAVLAAAAFETLGVAAILPFMNLVVDPSALDRYPVLRSAAAFVGVTSWRGTVVLAAVVTGAIIAAGNLAGAGGLSLRAHFAARTRHRLASGLLKAFLRQPYAFHTGRDAASLLKVVVQDVDNVIENMIAPLLNAVSRAFVVVALFALLAIESPTVASVAFVALGGAYLFVYQLVRPRQARLGEQASQAADSWQRGAYEVLGGVKDVIVLERQAAAHARFADAYKRFVDAQAGNIVTAAMPRYLLEAVAFMCILAATVAMLLRGDGGAVASIPALTLYAFIGYRLMPSLQYLFAEAATLRYGTASLHTLHAEWKRVEAGDEMRREERQPELRFTDRIALRDVSLTYPGALRPAIDHLSLDIHRGESVGLVGRTGAGKSTLADLLLGLFEPGAGTITVDGVALTSATTAAWRRRVGYVAQHVFLTNATLAENIAFGFESGEVDMTAVIEASRHAQLDGFVATLPNGYATVVGERGVRLSGGERQRVGIARALYRKPDVLVFDEATSALDGLTEEAVMEAIRTLSGDRTVILIAHRLRTLEACDRLVLLECGNLVAAGPLAELSRTSRAYAHFVAHA